MKINRKLSFLAAAVLVTNQFFVNPVYAQEFSISGNSDNSSNNISYQANQNTQVEQTNKAEIENNVESEAITGNNEASGNIGEVEIETGDIIEETVIVNSGNISLAQTECCVEDDLSSATIQENGVATDNSIEISDDSSTKVAVVNKLKLKNNVEVSANTGDNWAVDNDGEVTIQTGQIQILAQILNQNLNRADVLVSDPSKSFNYYIKNNGDGSINSITENNSSESTYSVYNNQNLVNEIKNSANTGGNIANKNSGKVFISTGDIFLDIILKNKDINISKIVDACCKKTNPTPAPSGRPSPSPSGSPSPPSSPSPSTPPGSCCSPTTDIPGPGGGGGTGGSSGEVLGASLPATGGFSLWTLTLFALLMTAAGVILRSDSGHGQDKFKEVYRKLVDHSKPYLFGAYLFANLKILSAVKT